LHVVYGLRVAANIPLPGLPVRLDSDVYDVSIRLQERGELPASFLESVEILYSSPHGEAPGEPSLRVGLLPGREYFSFVYADGVRFAVERRGREVWGDWPENYTLEDACTYLLGPVMGFVLRLRGVTCLHASAVSLEDYAVALVGFPGAGKSTTAAAFAHCGFSVIADDVVALTEDAENFLVQPGYPRVNLWPDSVGALFGSEQALPKITPTWEKRYLPLSDDGLRFATTPVPLRVIYLLGTRDAVGAPLFEEMSGGDAVAELVANTYVNYLLDRDMRSREFDVLSRIVAGIPVRRVRPTADSSALFDLCAAIARDARWVVARKSEGASPGRH